MRVFLIVMLFVGLVEAKFSYSIFPISKRVKNQMIKGKSYHKGCPVPINQLRYLRLKYIGFDGKEHTGELIVNKSVAKEVVSIFRELYSIKYPINKMRLVSRYGGNDWLSIENDNTSAFNCRNATGTKKWSKHSYGRAIDINPIENPYISSSGKIAHKASYKYKVRRRDILHPVYEVASCFKVPYLVNQDD